MNLERISDALQSYTGQEDSMHQVVSVFEEELGENWTQTVFQDLQSLPPILKNNLTQVFNYYAATVAWNEAQEYLADPQLELTPELQERLPILKHWLDFFRSQGQEVYNQLEERLAQLANTQQINEPTQSATETTTATELPTESDDTENLEEESAPLDNEPSSSDQGTEDQSNSTIDSPEIQELDTTTQADIDTPTDSSPISKESESTDMEQGAFDEETLAELENNPAYFEIKKLSSQLTLLEENQAWLAARCIQLKNIEIYAYPFYGFIVDLLRQALKSMEAIEADENATELLDLVFEGGKQAFDNKKEAIQHEIELAEQNCESATTALIADDVDMDEVKRTLGTIDTSDTVEYVGPAPDGFELLDDDTPLDENAIKQQYEKLENVDALTGQKEEISAQNEIQKENTSQNDQKGVQRKLSFSLKKKKPTGEG